MIRRKAVPAHEWREAVFADPHIKTTRGYIAMAMAQRADYHDGSKCSPSAETIAKMVGLRRREDVTRHIREFREGRISTMDERMVCPFVEP